MRALIPVLLLLAACGPSRTAMFKVERLRGVDGAWHREVHGKTIWMEAEGSDLRVRHGDLNFLLVHVSEFDGSYSYYTFEIQSRDFNAFFSPKGLTVRYRNEFRHFDPTELPTDLLIVIDGLDLRFEGLERQDG